MVLNENMLEEKFASAMSLFEKGEVQQAAKVFGHACSVEGIVMEGNRIGRTIGFPTANLKIDPNAPLPANGVYAAMTRLEGKWYKSMVNIGTRPTLNQSNLAIEVFLIGFEGEIYGKTLSVHFLKWLRSEVRFASLEHLRKQLIKDQQQSIDEIEKLIVFPNPMDRLVFLKPAEQQNPKRNDPELPCKME